MQWHFTESDPGDGPTNMARDEAQMRWSARTWKAGLRVYAWSVPTVSLGRNQRARGCYDLDEAGARGIAFVRRPTGGRALLHHREVTYCATLPASSSADARAAYEFINSVLISALRRLGAAVTRAAGAGAEALPPGLRPCFDAASSDELVIGERKLVGSAQWFHDGALLQHGSILLHDDQQSITGLLAPSVRGVAPTAATLTQALGREPPIAEVAAAIRGALVDKAGDASDLWDRQAIDAAANDLRPRYLAAEWTWRR